MSAAIKTLHNRIALIVTQCEHAIGKALMNQENIDSEILIKLAQYLNVVEAIKTDIETMEEEGKLWDQSEAS